MADFLQIPWDADSCCECRYCGGRVVLPHKWTKAGDVKWIVTGSRGNWISEEEVAEEVPR